MCANDLKQNALLPMCPRTLKFMFQFFRSGEINLHPSVFKTILVQAAELLRSQPNIIELNLTAGEGVIVCGDLHGNLPAVLRFFELNDLPLPSRKFIFNGDFVDRGSNSVEVLTLILSTYISFPDCVVLNRGNHEDVIVNKQLIGKQLVHLCTDIIEMTDGPFGLCANLKAEFEWIPVLRYGFKKELAYKYPDDGDSLLQACSDVFRQMPLACVINNTVLICHGGLSPLLDLQRLKRLERSKFVSVLSPCLDGPEAVDAHDWQQVLNLLWSDPQEVPGSRPNTLRGGGCHFGPDVTNDFLKRTGMQMIVRSHQCFPEGWKLTHAGALLTIFSSFDYLGHHSNEGVCAWLSVVRSEEIPHVHVNPNVLATLAPMPLSRTSGSVDEKWILLPQILSLPREQAK